MAKGGFATYFQFLVSDLIDPEEEVKHMDRQNILTRYSMEWDVFVLSLDLVQVITKRETQFMSESAHNKGQ